jgi:hypothetical protein
MVLSAYLALSCLSDEAWFDIGFDMHLYYVRGWVCNWDIERILIDLLSAFDLKVEGSALCKHGRGTGREPVRGVDLERWLSGVAISPNNLTATKSSAPSSSCHALDRFLPVRHHEGRAS